MDFRRKDEIAERANVVMPMYYLSMDSIWSLCFLPRAQ